MNKHIYLKYGLILVCCICFGLDIYSNTQLSELSQNSTVSLNMTNVSIKEVFNEIEKQTKLVFIYNDNDVDTDIKTSVNATSEDVANVLSKMLVDTDITCSVGDKHIVLKKTYVQALPSRPKTADEKQNTSKKIKGEIIDVNNEPIIGATIYLK